MDDIWRPCVASVTPLWMASGPGNKVRKTPRLTEADGGEKQTQGQFCCPECSARNEGTQLLEPLQAINAGLVVDIPNLLLARAWQRHARLPIGVRGGREVAQSYILGEDVWVAWMRDAERLTTKSRRARRFHVCQGARLPNHLSAASHDGQVSSLVRAELMSRCMCVPPLSDGVKMASKSWAARREWWTSTGDHLRSICGGPWWSDWVK